MRVRFFRAKVVIVRVLYLSLLTVASEFRLSLHPFRVLGIRGWVIVGTHHLVVRPAEELKPSSDWYGIVYLRVSPFNPVSSRNIPAPG
jgi:hypothetical protein